MSKFLTRKVIVLILAIVISASAVTGGTIAWFTDTVTSSGNVIQAGTLDVGLYAADTHNAAEADWKDVEAENAAPVFNYDKWEPGYTQLKYAKIVNKGNLAFKFHINVKPTNPDPAAAYELADVIDVYYKVVDEGFAAPASFADVAAGWTKAGSISELIEKEKTAVDGVMLGDQAPMTIALALHMQETADNNYQGLSVGEGFALELVATQYTKESDSFDDQYDAGATYDDGLPKADVVEIADEAKIAEIKGTKFIFATFDEYGNYTVDTSGKLIDPEIAYSFKATETAEEALENPYWYYNADFEVSVSKDLPGGIIGLLGEYGNLPVAFDVSENLAKAATGGKSTVIPAGESFRLLEPFFPINYKEICEVVGEFICGAYYTDAAKENPELIEQIKGTILTVKLCLYETYQPNENGNATPEEVPGGERHCIGTYTYAF